VFLGVSHERSEDIYSLRPSEALRLLSNVRGKQWLDENFIEKQAGHTLLFPMPAHE